MRRFTLAGDVSGEPYWDLLRHAAAKGLVGLLADPEAAPSPRREAFLEALSPFVLRDDRLSRWPGSRLEEGEARVLRFRLSSQSAELLRAEAPSLFSWLGPERCEDLCLLRPSGAQYMVTVARRRDAWFDLSGTEREELAGAVPTLRLGLDRDQPREYRTGDPA